MHDTPESVALPLFVTEYVIERLLLKLESTEC